MWQEGPSEDLVPKLLEMEAPSHLYLHCYPQFQDAVSFLLLDYCTDSKLISQIYYSYPTVTQ